MPSAIFLDGPLGSYISGILRWTIHEIYDTVFLHERKTKGEKEKHKSIENWELRGHFVFTRSQLIFNC